MNIIIVDKDADIPDWRKLLNGFIEKLQGHGHSVEGPYRNLIEGYEPMVDLDKYQIAIAHPKLIKEEGGLAQLIMLDKETKKRPDFRVIFYSEIDKYEEEIRIPRSDQVCYLDKGLDVFDRIIELVEKGR